MIPRDAPGLLSQVFSKQPQQGRRRYDALDHTSLHFHLIFATKDRKYIREQEAHHHQKTFQEGYVEFLGQSGIEYDERYLW